LLFLSALLTVHFFSSGEEFFMRASTGGNLQSAIRNPQSAIRNPQSAIGLRAKPAPSSLRPLREIPLFLLFLYPLNPC
jgi:hypothetical protein